MSEQTRPHPTTGTYAVVATVLAVLTALEVTVFYLRVLRPVLVPVLLLLAAAKFALVVMFYMHLRFDRWAYGAIFLGQLLAAAVVVISLSLLFLAFFAGSA